MNVKPRIKTGHALDKLIVLRFIIAIGYRIKSVGNGRAGCSAGTGKGMKVAGNRGLEPGWGYNSMVPGTGIEPVRGSPLEGF
jgi:hypothetical protein